MASLTEYAHKEAISAMAISQNKFTSDLYMVLAKEKNGNIFFSPFSIATALSMVYIGSENQTEAQMKHVMHLPSEKSTIQKAFFDLINEYKKQHKHFELRTSNKIYMSDQFTAKEKFTSAMNQDFLASFKLVDFVKSSEAVRKEINDAVEKETNAKIQNLINPDVLDSRTAMVLVNAIYFKGFWLHPFNPQSTQHKPFWVTPEESIQIPMMTLKENFSISYNSELSASILSLEYKDPLVSMIIVLPNVKDGLDAVEEKLSSFNWQDLDKDARSVEVPVTIPKFKMEQTFELSQTLLSMGMKDLFTSGVADLSGISEKEDLSVSNAIHKAFLEVNEEGSEAAAATAVVICMRAAIIRPRPPFVADHPFMFLIRDNISKLVLFAGRFTHPEQS